MKKELIFSMLLFAAMPNVVAQQEQMPSARAEFMPQKEVSTFQQVDKVRKALNLDQKQFEKVYKAYESYNKAIYGDSNQSSMPMQGGPRGGMGGPGGGPGGPGGGMGGPGGGMGGPGGGMGAPGGDGGSRPDFSSNSDSRPTPPKELSEKDIEKMHKKMQKQEEKLRKSVRKVLKDDAVYAKWTQMRDEEIMPPRHQPHDEPQATQK